MNNQKNNQVSKKPETTGHNWDGIQEYNTPAPRWWLIVWIICIIYAIGYWFVYPTWPTISGNTPGLEKWTATSQLKDQQAEINARKDIYLKKFSKASFVEIKKDPELMNFAIEGGKATFKNNCAVCHGTGAQGQKGFPNLNDDDWLWGGKIEDIYTTIKYGIRSTSDKTRNSAMPAFGIDQILTPEEINNVAEYVMSLSKAGPFNAKGQEIFKNNCVACHGVNGKGSQEVGAPNLTDTIWLYGGTKEDIVYTITHSRAGVMPTWAGRLDDDTIRQVAIYIHSLGGGQ